MTRHATATGATMTVATAASTTAAMVAISSAAKGKAASRVYGLRTFLDPGCPMDFYGAFRGNVRGFLRECADVEEATTERMPTWRTMLVDEKTGIVVPVYTVEECVRGSLRPFCDYCRCAGWSHHLVSKRRYHVIVPADEDWDKPLRHDALQVHDRHLLHGLFHCNGFGHLVLLNGRDAGSRFFPSRLLMDLWDRLCSALRAREVSVEDVSTKHSMELRLLYGMAYGITWFGRWGYRFSKGCYGVTEDSYNLALHELSSLRVSALISDLTSASNDRELRRVVALYRELCRRHHLDLPQPLTVRELLRFLLEFKRRPAQHQQDEVPFLPPTPQPKPSTSQKQMKKAAASKKRKRYREFEEIAEGLQSRWSVRRLCTSAQVIADALRVHGRKMTRQEVRDAARLAIGDTGLIDFVVKSIGDCVVGGHVVRRVSNPKTRVLEFSLEGTSNATSEEDTEVVAFVGPPRSLSSSPMAANATWPTAAQVEKDVRAVYRSLLAGRPELTQIVLNGKHWRKSWGLQDDADDRLRFLVKWMPSSEELQELKRGLPPPEVVVIEATASVGELVAEAERAMRDTYCALEKFTAEGLDGVKGEEWDPVLVGGAESGATVWVYGTGADVGVGSSPGGEGGLLKYEGGTETWAVSCVCGTRDDDGERMVACDCCDVWQHTRCAGIPDGEPVPPIFLCERCGSAIFLNDNMLRWHDD